MKKYVYVSTPFEFQPLEFHSSTTYYFLQKLRLQQPVTLKQNPPLKNHRKSTSKPKVIEDFEKLHTWFGISGSGVSLIHYFLLKLHLQQPVTLMQNPPSKNQRKSPSKPKILKPVKNREKLHTLRISAPGVSLIHLHNFAPTTGTNSGLDLTRKSLLH